MWRWSRSKSWLFRKIERNRYHDFLEQVWLDSDTVLLSGTGDRRRKSQNGIYTPASLITPSVQEFIYSTPHIGGEKIKIESTSNSLLKKIESRGKTTILTSLLSCSMPEFTSVNRLPWIDVWSMLYLKLCILQFILYRKTCQGSTRSRSVFSRTSAALTNCRRPWTSSCPILKSESCVVAFSRFSQHRWKTSDGISPNLACR